MRQLPPAALAILDAQYGMATRRQLLDVGMKPGEVDGIVYRKVLDRPFNATYRQPGSAHPPEQPAMAAALRCRPKAWVTGPFVLGLFGVEGFTKEDSFGIIVPARRSVSNVPFDVEAVDIPHRYTVTYVNLPITNVTWSLIDTAKRVQGKRLIVAIDSARWKRRTDPNALRECAVLRDHEGGEYVLQLLDDGVFDAESEGERDMWSLIRHLDPQPEAQVWLAPHIRVDGYWRDIAHALEYRGRQHHSSPAQRADDAQRDRDIAALGVTVSHLTAEDLRHPQATVARLMSTRGQKLRALGLA